MLLWPDQLPDVLLEVELVQLHSSARYDENVLVPEDPVEPDDVRVVLFQRKRALLAVVCRHVDELHARVARLNWQDSRRAARKLDALHRPAEGNCDTTVFRRFHALHFDVCESLLDAEHLEVGQVKEASLGLVERVERERYLLQLQVVRPARYSHLVNDLALVTFEPRLLLNNDEVYTIIIMADYVPIFPHRIAPKFPRLFSIIIILDFLWQFWWHGTNDQLFRIKNKNVHILRKIMWLYCHYSDRLYQHLNYLHVLSFHCHYSLVTVFVTFFVLDNFFTSFGCWSSDSAMHCHILSIINLSLSLRLTANVHISSYRFLLLEKNILCV